MSVDCVCSRCCRGVQAALFSSHLLLPPAWLQGYRAAPLYQPIICALGKYRVSEVKSPAPSSQLSVDTSESLPSAHRGKTLPPPPTASPTHTDTCSQSKPDNINLCPHHNMPPPLHGPQSGWESGHMANETKLSTKMHLSPSQIAF